MSSALILGDRGSGLTTFVGLLYTAQVRLGSDRADGFRFSADRESIRRLQDIYVALGDGRFPENDIDWVEQPLSFVFGFRRSRFAWLGRGRNGPDGGFDTVRIQVGGLPVDEVAELRNHDAVLDGLTRRLLRSPIVILLVDARGLTPDPAGIGELPMRRYDLVLAQTLDLLRKFHAAERGRRRTRMCPVFVVTKFDQLIPGPLDGLEVPRGPPERWTPDARKAVGDRLLVRHLPETGRVLLAHPSGGGLVSAPKWFFSGVETEEAVSGEPRIVRRLRSPAGGWEPSYPLEEYRGLLNLLGRLAHRLPDEGVADPEWDFSGVSDRSAR